jgi:hypothetical protein
VHRSVPWEKHGTSCTASRMFEPKTPSCPYLRGETGCRRASCNRDYKPTLYWLINGGLPTSCSWPALSASLAKQPGYRAYRPTAWIMASYGARYASQPFFRFSSSERLTLPSSSSTSSSNPYSLPDSEPLVHQRATSHLALLPAFSSFLSTLGSLNRDYTHKAASHIGAFRLQIAKSAQERAGDSATTERALSGVLEQVDLQVRMAGEGFEMTAREVAARMEQVGSRLDAVRKRHHQFYAQLMTQRDKAYEQRDRSRSAYFSACEAVESARQKRATAKEGRDSDKATRVYDAAYSEMLLAKDQYLVDLDGANVAKQRIYSVHLPHLIDEYQSLEASAVKQLEDLLGRMLEIQTESGQKVLQAVDKAKQALATIDVGADQQAFVTQHATTLMAAYEHPPDLLFEECPVWHDTVSPRFPTRHRQRLGRLTSSRTRAQDDFAITPAAIVYLQNVKSKAQSKIGEISPAIETKRREVGSLQNLRDTYEASRGLGDTVGVIEVSSLGCVRLLGQPLRALFRGIAGWLLERAVQS